MLLDIQEVTLLADGVPLDDGNIVAYLRCLARFGFPNMPRDVTQEIAMKDQGVGRLLGLIFAGSTNTSSYYGEVECVLWSKDDGLTLVARTNDGQVFKAMLVTEGIPVPHSDDVWCLSLEDGPTMTLNEATISDLPCVIAVYPLRAEETSYEVPATWDGTIRMMQMRRVA